MVRVHPVHVPPGGEGNRGGEGRVPSPQVCPGGGGGLVPQPGDPNHPPPPTPAKSGLE